MNGYPDDIRQYDHDPRSPFYVGNPECPNCDTEMELDVWGEWICGFCKNSEEE